MASGADWLVPIKRVEIVIESVHLPALRAVLDEVGVPGYTILERAKGKGDRGEQGGDELTDVFNNTYVITACSESLAHTVATRVRPILTRFGGLCLISEAQVLEH